MSSQVCPNEQDNFRMKFNIDLEVILNVNDGSVSERPTPSAKKNQINNNPNNCNTSQYGSMKNRSAVVVGSPEYG